MLQERLRRFADGLGNVIVESVAHAAKPYHVTDVHDDEADALGHMPYAPEFYAALGTVTARIVRRALVKPVRTIVVDPLRWQPTLLRLLRPALRRGATLALCSPDDVGTLNLERLPIHPDEITVVRGGLSMIDHFAELAATGDRAEYLVLAPDPETCAAFREKFPETPCVELPTDPLALRELLAHVWYLDPRSARRPNPAPLRSLSRRPPRGARSSA